MIYFFDQPEIFKFFTFLPEETQQNCVTPLQNFKRPNQDT